MEETWGNGHYSCYGCKYESSKDAISCKRCLTYTPLMKPYYQNWTQKEQVATKKDTFTDHLIDLGYQRGYKKAIEDVFEIMDNAGAHSSDWDEHCLCYWIGYLKAEIETEMKGE